MSELREALTDIQGVGDATADKILDAVEAHADSDVPEDLAENVRSAWDYHHNGDYGYAGKFLERAAESVE